MRTAGEIYAEYRIMPSLQLHQLRVAAVAKMICDNLIVPVDSRTVVLAAILHDMGNILKFDLTVFPESVQPEGLEYWKTVKADFEKKYGTDQHAASLAIAKELGLSEEVQKCIDSVAFAKAEEVRDASSIEQKICEYADSRVAPHGIVPMDERLEEGRKRYLNRTVETGLAAARARFDALKKAEEDIERDIFSHSRIQSTDITDAATAPLIEELRKYPVA